MKRVKVTFYYTPEDGALDSADETGVTEEEFDRVHEVLGMEFGAVNVRVQIAQEPS